MPPCYDPDHALVLCRLHGFREGLVFLYDRYGIAAPAAHVASADSSASLFYALRRTGCGYPARRCRCAPASHRACSTRAHAGIRTSINVEDPCWQRQQVLHDMLCPLAHVLSFRWPSRQVYMASGDHVGLIHAVLQYGDASRWATLP